MSIFSLSEIVLLNQFIATATTFVQTDLDSKSYSKNIEQRLAEATHN